MRQTNQAFILHKKRSVNANLSGTCNVFPSINKTASCVSDASRHFEFCKSAENIQNVNKMTPGARSSNNFRCLGRPYNAITKHFPQILKIHYSPS